MNAKIEITKEMLTNARDYVPLAEKEAWVSENADKCFDKLAISADDEPMPPMYMVNTGLKSRYLMGALVKLYFGIYVNTEVEAGGIVTDEWLMSVEEYDAWAGSHVFNQMERWKRDPDMKTKAYDLIFDYKDLEKRFSAQISSLLSVQNDGVIRENELRSSYVKELPALIEQLQAMQGENKDAAD